MWRATAAADAVVTPIATSTSPSIGIHRAFRSRDEVS